MPVLRAFDKGLIYPAVTRNLHFPHAAIAMPNKRFLQKFVLPFSTKIFYLNELVIKWSDEAKDKGSKSADGKGGCGVSLPAEYDAAVTNLVSSLPL